MKVLHLTLNGVGVGGEIHPPEVFSTVPKRLAIESWNFLTFNINLWVIFCSSFYWYLIYYVTMATVLLNRGRINLVRSNIKPIYLYPIQFVWQNWHEIWNQRLRIDPSTKFQLDPSKNRKVGRKLDFDPKNKESRNYSGPVITSLILSRFWIEFVTYFHTTKFCFNWPSNNGNKGGIHPHTSWTFQTPYHLGLSISVCEKWSRNPAKSKDFGIVFDHYVGVRWSWLKMAVHSYFF